MNARTQSLAAESGYTGSRSLVCDNASVARDLCKKHYRRWQRHGDPIKTLRPANGEAQAYYRDVVLAYKGDECLTWPFGKSCGYGVINIGGMQRISRLVCEDEHGTAPSQHHHAAHSCGKGHLGCVARSHLSWKTPVENNADKVSHGTHRSGEEIGFSKLTSDDVRKIIALKGRLSASDIAEMFGVTASNIYVIFAGKTWRKEQAQ